MSYPLYDTFEYIIKNIIQEDQYTNITDLERYISIKFKNIDGLNLDSNDIDLIMLWIRQWKKPSDRWIVHQTTRNKIYFYDLKDLFNFIQTYKKEN